MITRTEWSREFHYHKNRTQLTESFIITRIERSSHSAKEAKVILVFSYDSCTLSAVIAFITTTTLLHGDIKHVVFRFQVRNQVELQFPRRSR